MRACGTVLRKSFVCSIRGRKRSSANFSSPMHFALASTLTNGFPTTRKLRLPPLFPAINSLLGGFGFFTGHPRGGQFHGFQDFDVSRTAAKVSRKCFLDFVSRRAGVVLEESFRGQENSRGAISALSSAEFSKRLLQRMKLGSYG